MATNPPRSLPGLAQGAGNEPDSVMTRQHSSLSKDFAWMLIGNAIYAAGQWLILVILAKIVRPEVVGQYAWAWAIAVPIFTCASLQLRLALASDVCETIHFGYYLGLRLFTTGFAFAAAGATVWILDRNWSLMAMILIIAFVQATDAISDIYYGRLQLRDRVIQIAKSLLARTMISITGFTIALYVGRNIFWALAVMALGRLTVLIGYDASGRTHALCRSDVNTALSPRYSLPLQRDLLLFSLPLSLIAAFVSLNFMIPRYFIQYLMGNRALGIFSAFAAMLTAGCMAIVSFGQSVFTPLARSYITRDFVQFRSLLLKLLSLGVVLGICGIVIAKLFGREILIILFRPEYAEEAHLLPWVMGVGAIAYVGQCLGYALTAARYYYSQAMLFVLTNIIVALACYILIPTRGLLGAILAMLLAMVAQVGGSVVILLNGTRNHERLNTMNVSTAQPDILLQA